MAVTKVGHAQWHSSFTGQTYESEMAARHYEKEMRMASSAQSEGSKLIDSLTTEQLKSLVIESKIRADQIEGNLDWNQVQNEFVAANPDYVANTRNASALAAVLIDRGKLTPEGTFLGTMEDMQEAYIDLAEKNVLELRKGARVPHRVDDEAEAYAMPLEELRFKSYGIVKDGQQPRPRGW